MLALTQVSVWGGRKGGIFYLFSLIKCRPLIELCKTVFPSLLPPLFPTFCTSPQSPPHRTQFFLACRDSVLRKYRRTGLRRQFVYGHGSGVSRGEGRLGVTFVGRRGSWGAGFLPFHSTFVFKLKVVLSTVGNLSGIRPDFSFQRSFVEEDVRFRSENFLVNGRNFEKKFFFRFFFQNFLIVWCCEKFSKKKIDYVIAD